MSIAVQIPSGQDHTAFRLSEQEKELDAMTNFMYSLRAVESRRQYPPRLKLNLAFVGSSTLK